MMKWLIYLGSIVVYALQCSAQCHFYQVFDHSGYSDGGNAIIETSEGAYLIGGEALLFTTDAAWLIKLDECGDTLWTNNYILSPGSGGERVRSIIENEDGTFTLSGSHHDHNEGAASSFLAKISSNGDSLWHKIVDAGYNDWGQAAIPSGDGGYIIGGYFKQQIPNHHLFLLKTDSAGNIEWQQEYGQDTSYNYFGSVEKTPDGGYIIASREEYALSAFFARSDAWIIKTDSAGNEEWKKNFRGINNEEAGIAHAINTRDGGYILVGTVQDSLTDRYTSYCIKTDGSGNKQWMRYYDYSQYDFFEVIHQLPNGDYIAGGGVETSGGAQRIRLTKIKENGTHVWTKIYGYYGISNSYDYLTDMIIDHEGNIVVTGYVIPPHGVTTGNDMFILKVDSAGELLTSTGNVLPLPGQAVSIYPNPAYDEFKVEGLKLKGGESYELKLYDVVGRNVLMEKLENEQISIDVSSLESGIYLWEVHDENEAIATGKLVKQ